MSHGVEEIRRLRTRQIADGKTEVTDQRYKAGELIHLACAMLLHKNVTGEALIPDWCTAEADRLAAKCTPSELIAHAGACLAAEIDRSVYNPFACQRCWANIAPEYRYEGPGGFYHGTCLRANDPPVPGPPDPPRPVKRREWA